MKTLIVATSAKPPNFDYELKLGKRYRLEYLDLSQHLSASYMDYDPPWMHMHKLTRRLEERIHIDFFWAQQIARKVKQEGFDCVISMSERIGVPLGYVLDRNVKHIAILINAMSRKWLFAIRFLKIQQRWDHIVTYSHAEAEALSNELHISPNKVTTILNYVDSDFFKPTGKRILEETTPFIMSLGVAKRDYPTLIAAMWKLTHIECHISAFSAWDDFKGGYQGLEIPSNIIMKSYNHPSIIKNVLARCRFLVVPLRSDIGMWCSGSTSVLQAQAMGKPVIVTYLPGIAEYVKDGETGILVGGNNPDTLAEAIDFLWRNPEQTEAMGRQGQKWVQHKFSLKNWIDNMTALLGETSRPAQGRYRFRPHF